ncbi:hypothetical protein KQX54_021379 [Cotesia glomerata]|uniref:Uncharacterized protein n=1 Tax=Cotesia glomerata TaxID=32391 RepID=A0AAV7JAG2_COTGL|nr:hypothetical protein KQX54_021379 [Cotesia glomerata]
MTFRYVVTDGNTGGVVKRKPKSKLKPKPNEMPHTERNKTRSSQRLNLLLLLLLMRYTRNQVIVVSFYCEDAAYGHTALRYFRALLCFYYVVLEIQEAISTTDAVYPLELTNVYGSFTDYVYVCVCVCLRSDVMLKQRRLR